MSGSDHIKVPRVLHAIVIMFMHTIELALPLCNTRLVYAFICLLKCLYVQGFVFVYDITNEASFHDISKMIGSAKEAIAMYSIVVLYVY